VEGRLQRMGMGPGVGSPSHAECGDYRKRLSSWLHSSAKPVVC